MAIPASRIVQITPRVVQAAGTDLALNGMFLTTSRIVPLGRMRSYPNADAVGDEFGYASEEYKAAAVYFAGYEGAFKRPRVAWFGSRTGATAPAVLQGGTPGSLSDIQGVTSGSLSISINGMDISLSGLDFSSATAIADAATTLQTALAAKLHGVKCSYADSKFSVTAPQTPSGSTISLASGNAAEVLGLAAAKSASVVSEAFTPGGAVCAVLKGAPVKATLEQLKAVTAGELSMTIDGTAASDDAINLSGANSFSDVAAIIGAKLAADVPGTVCAYSSLTKAFWVYSPTTGSSSTVTVADRTELALLLGLCEATPADKNASTAGGRLGTSGADAEQGMDDTTVAENFAMLKGSSENWALFTTVYEASDEESLELAGWAAAQGVEYLYVAWSTDSALKNPDEETSLAVVLKERNNDGAALVFGDLPYAAFILGIPASIDWDREQGVVTAAFKHQGGLAPVIDNASEAEVLLSKRCNFYGTYASRNDSFVWLYDGACYGDYRFMDAYWNTIWLSSAIQTACMLGFKQTPRVPYNEDGFTLIRSWIQDPINRGLRNGCIDAGLSLSEAQKAQFLNETGLNDQALSVLENDGYFLSIKDAGPSSRPNRDSPTIYCYYCYAGSVHRLDIPATMFV